MVLTRVSLQLGGHSLPTGTHLARYTSPAVMARVFVQETPAAILKVSDPAFTILFLAILLTCLSSSLHNIRRTCCLIFTNHIPPLLLRCNQTPPRTCLQTLVPCNARYYIWELGRYIALTLCFIAGFILWGHATDLTEPVGSQAIAGTLTRVSCWILTLYNLLVEEGREFRAAKTARK